MKSLKKLLVTGSTVATAIALSFVMNGFDAFAHGYINEGRASLAKQGINVNAGTVQYEPQSIEGKGNFPLAGPADGQLASAGIFLEMDEQTEDRWVKIPVNTGANTFTWTLTAPHRTSEFKYYITKDGWNPNEPITRADLEEIAVFDYNDTIPEKVEVHTFDIPANKSGYHVILGVWEVADTGNAFYQVVDVEVSGDAVADTIAPSMPTNLTAAATINSVSLNWTASTDNTGVHHYDVYRDGVKVGTSTTTQFVDTDLVANTTYTYTVKAVDRAGNTSDASEILSVTTQELPAVDTEAPTAPARLHSMGETDSTINLMWAQSTDNVAVAYYQIFRNGVLVATTTETSFKDANLAANTEYTYTVAAVDASNNASVMSNTLVVSTKEKEVVEGNTTWNKDSVYLQGDIVVFDGVEYTAKWWTQGDLPGSADVWELVNKDITVNWTATKAYSGGDKVVYEGQTFQAKWWTQGDVPTEASVWELVK